MNVFYTPERKLRHGWWIGIFFLLLAMLVVPATIYMASLEAKVPMTWQALMVFVVTWACLALRHEPLAEILGPAKSYVLGIPLGIALGLGIWLVTAAVLWLTGSITWQLNPEAALALRTGIGEGIAVAIAEELIFRGFIFKRLMDGVGQWPAQLLMAAYFLLNHWNNPGMIGPTRIIAAINILLAGLLFGAVYIRTKSLAIPIALHFALNFTQGNLLGLGVSGHENPGVLSPTFQSTRTWWTGGSFGLEASLPGTVMIFIVFVLVLKWKVPSKNTSGTT